MAPRPTGSAVIVLGLERVPIRVFPATVEAPRISFTTICQQHGSKVEQLQRCAVDGKVFEKAKEGEKPEGLVSAYQLGKGNFLTLSAEELEEIQPKPDPEIVIVAVCELEDVDEVLWNGTAQFLDVDAGEGEIRDTKAIQAYADFAQSLAEASDGESVVAIGRWANRGTDKLVGIYRRPDGRLQLQGLRRAAELRDATEIDPPAEATSSGLGKMTAILQRLRVERLDTGAYPDTRHTAAVAALQAKAAERAEAPRKVPRRARAAR